MGSVVNAVVVQKGYGVNVQVVNDLCMASVQGFYGAQIFLVQGEVKNG